MRITVVCGAGQNTSFVDPLIAHWRASGHHVEMQRSALAAIDYLEGRTDLIWCEWCDPIALWVLAQRRVAPVIVRLHRYELYRGWAEQANWQTADHLVLVSDWMRRAVQRVADPCCRLHVIHNGIDLDRYAIPDRPLSPPGRGQQIGFAGYLSWKKGIPLALEIMRELRARDVAATLHIAGLYQQADLADYVQAYVVRYSLCESVRHHGWVDDMPAWWPHMDYVLSTSVTESFHYALAEAMACGCTPLIHCWPGADELWPQGRIFGSATEAAHMIQHDGIDPEGARAWVKRYSLCRQLDAVDALLREVTHA